MDPESLPSNADEVEDDRSHPELMPKHTIFLSHNGAQKPFVEQLCKDLEDACYYPFFDQRDDSLPKGKKFADLIFEAARKCRVAVVVLSKEFLSSKWPMQELAEFVNAMESDNKKLSLLPLFFKLSVSELSNESISNTWRLEWTELAKGDPTRVDVKKWEKAVQKLRGVNGHNFALFGGSEVKYREAVVKSIFKLVRPELLYNTSDVQGCDRLCEILSKRFVEHPPSSSKQPQKLGLYGMGGLGKSTMCRALCNHFQEEFCGRVCHVDLGSEDFLDLQKQVLKMLSVNEEMLQRIADRSQGQEALKEQMRRYPVFLAIDNVGDSEDCREKAGDFLRANINPSSKVMVVSRSKHVVEALLKDPEYCKPLPDLMMEEAAAIFLSKAAPKKKFSSLDFEERRIVDVCLGECRFFPDADTNADVKKNRQYHPLALRALGVYFHDISSTNLSLWKRRLDEYDKLKRSRDCPRIFHILGSQFSTFDETKKLMFLDVALYARGWFGSFTLQSFEQWVKWLAALHNGMNLTVVDVEDMLGDLQRNAMINVGKSAITTHDLYKEYAEWYVSKSEDRKPRWCIYQEHAENLPHELASSCPSAGGCWPDLMRISIEGSLKRFSWKKVQEWRNIVVLQMYYCGEITILDLHGFSSLCHLELMGLTKLETLKFSEDDDEDDCPFKLQFVFLKELDALKRLPSFSSCTSLRMFIMRECPGLTEPLTSLESCSHLDTFEMDWYPGRSCAPNLTSMTSLNNLSIVNTQNQNAVSPIHELEGLGDLTNLRFLNLSRLPIERLPGLERLSNLRRITLEHCVRLTELPDLSGLAQVEVLNVSWTGVREIRGVDRMSKLRNLDCRWCMELVELPDLHCLSGLRNVTTRGCSRLSTNPKVPKHPCFHDKDKLESAGSKKKSTTSSEVDSDPFDHIGPDCFEILIPAPGS